MALLKIARDLHQITADACSAPHSFQSLAVLGLRHIWILAASLRSPIAKIQTSGIGQTLCTIVGPGGRHRVGRRFKANNFLAR